MKTLIFNTGLILKRDDAVPFLAGKEMASIETISSGWILMEDERIHSYDKGNVYPDADDKIDADGGMILPAWCDSHTHLVFAASREGEFVDRIRGLSYEEIARRGGGILNSAKRLQETSEDDLLESTLHRADEIMSFGTGAVEIKSGYGLTVADEIKMLRVAKRLKALTPLHIKTTFLGAHAIPSEFKEKREKYVDLIINEMIPQVAEEKLADYCDVFCDRGFFTPEETSRILTAAADLGMPPKIHANELGYTGGIQVGVQHKALSVDHLEFTGDEEIETLLNSSTMPTLLPSTAFFLGLHYPPARKMIDAGLPLAMATDYNPGSSPGGSMWFIFSLGCIKLKMLPEEAFNALTINSAYAMGAEKDYGSITPGKMANIIITRPAPSLAWFPYSFSSAHAETVILRGKVI